MGKAWICWFLLVCMLASACIAQTAAASETAFDPATLRANYNNTKEYFFESVANKLFHAVSVKRYGEEATDVFESDLRTYDIILGAFPEKVSDGSSDPFFLIWGNCYNFYKGFPFGGHAVLGVAQYEVIQVAMDMNEQYSDFESIPESELTVAIASINSIVTLYQNAAEALEKASVAPVTEMAIPQATLAATQQSLPDSPSSDSRLPTAPPVSATEPPVAEAALTNYVRFDVKRGYYADWETVVIRQKSTRAHEGYESRNGFIASFPAYVTATYENDWQDSYNGTTSNYGFYIALPVVESATVLDSAQLVGEEYLYIALDFTFRSTTLLGDYPIFVTQSIYDRETESYRISLLEDKSFYIEITSVSADGLTYAGTFSASWGTQESKTKVENGEFHFTLVDPEW